MSRPATERVAVRLNGRNPTGDRLPEFLRDLGNPRAIYRIAGLCVRGEAGISIIFGSGQNMGEGEILYRSGTARFESGRMTNYSGSEASNAEGFWTR
jgi:hypothetical protein